MPPRMDESIQSGQNTLSIRLGTDGFSFSILNPLESGSPVPQAYPVDITLSLTANVKRACNEIAAWNLPYRAVNILQGGKRFSPVPLEFFEDEQAESLFYHNHTRKENETVLYNLLQRSGIAMLFGMDKSAYTFLAARFPQARFYSASTPIVEYLSTRSRAGNSRKLYANLHADSMDVYAFERGQLLLANAFTCKATADRLYYLLYIWKQLGLEQERDELHLTGDLSDKGELLPELKRYIRQCFVMNPASHLDLYAITPCV